MQKPSYSYGFNPNPQNAGSQGLKTGGAAEDIRIIVSRTGVVGPVSGNYAIAWWAGDATTLPGDYDKDGSVDSQDYDVWKSNFGTNFADADGNGNGTIDAGDYTIWRDNLGAGAGSLASVPEPSALWLAQAGLAFIFNHRIARKLGPRRRRIAGRPHQDSDG